MEKIGTNGSSLIKKRRCLQGSCTQPPVCHPERRRSRRMTVVFSGWVPLSGMGKYRNVLGRVKNPPLRQRPCRGGFLTLPEMYRKPPCRTYAPSSLLKAGAKAAAPQGNGLPRACRPSQWQRWTRDGCVFPAEHLSASYRAMLSSIISCHKVLYSP